MLKCKCPLNLWLTDEWIVILASLNLDAFHSDRTHASLANLQGYNALRIHLHFIMDDMVI